VPRRSLNVSKQAGSLFWLALLGRRCIFTAEDTKMGRWL